MSTNKIVMLLVFLCAALISSLFIYRFSHQMPPLTLAEDKGTIFTITREIKPFELVAATDEKFTEKNLAGHWTLMFFGFTHCSSICPTTLEVLNRAYEKLHPAYPNLQVVMISLDPTRDSIDVLRNYTQKFNQDFIGVSGKTQNLRKLQSQLGVFSENDGKNSNGDYQIQHTASIMLIDPHGKWAGIFSNGMKPDELAQGFEIAVKSLSRT